MTFSYTKKPGTRVIDKVRFMIGDTIDDKHLVDDEEIEFAFIEEDATLIVYTRKQMYGACARLCDAIAARFAREAEIKTSQFNSSKSSVYRKYLDLAKRFRSRFEDISSFVCPSISVSEKETNATDPSIVQPGFKKGLFDNVAYTGDSELSVDETVD